MTVQNEAKAVQTWDSCVYTAEEERDFVRDYLGPRLEKLGVKIMFWDHNKERLYERAKVMYSDPRTAGYIYGSAFHWYSGDHFEQLAITAQQYPDKKLIFTEGCQEYSKNVSESWLIGERYAHDMIGNFNHGCNAFTDWNLLLNEKGGPNHVSNFCDAPILADTSNDSFSFSNSYYYIGHFSKYIKPGAKRIAFSKYTDLLDACAFQNPDGDMVLILLNRTQEPRRLTVRLSGQLAELTAEPRSILTCLVRR